jgi:toxin ParE1/3/4
MEETQFPYELSQEADNDLEEIFDYTQVQFGSEQAIKYLLGFESLFENLCIHPETGRTRDEIRKGLRSISHISHVVFYRILKDRIRIVRVLHSGRDLQKLIPPKG